MLNGIYLCMLTRLLDGVFSDRAAPKIKHERLTLQLVQPAVCIFFLSRFGSPRSPVRRPRSALTTLE